MKTFKINDLPNEVYKMLQQVQSSMKKTEHNQLSRAERITPKNIIRVVDTHTKLIVGRLINISETGMKLLMDESILENQDLELSVVIKNRQGEKQYIEIIPEIVWLNKLENSENVEAGFKITCVNLKSKFRLKSAINRFSQAQN